MDKVTGTALGQTEPARQPKMSRLGQAPAVYFDNSFLLGSIAQGGLAKFLDGCIFLLDDSFIKFI